MGQGRGEEEKKRGKKSNLPNTFDDDCGYNKQLAINIFVEHCNKSEVFPIDTDLYNKKRHETKVLSK